MTPLKRVLSFLAILMCGYTLGYIAAVLITTGLLDAAFPSLRGDHSLHLHRLPRFTGQSVANDSFILPTFDVSNIAANWRKHTSCSIDDVEKGYPSDLGGVSTKCRICHFASSQAFGPPDKNQIEENLSGPARVATTVLLDLYTQFGILSSKRAGSLLGIFRAGGHLKGDGATGDHYLFLPVFSQFGREKSLACAHEAYSFVAKQHGCTVGKLYVAWPQVSMDAMGASLYCDRYDSHGTVYTAQSLLFDVDKNEMLAKYGIYIHDALRSLCFAPFNGIHAMSFDSPHVQTMLAAGYGENYLVPIPGKKQSLPDWLTDLSQNEYRKSYQDLNNLMDPHEVKLYNGPDPLYMFRSVVKNKK
jgi:hypothetical protein